ncbi:unnamed protein product [Lasius platythorax]|uniref:Uncharacterized protein n=1 Tax=Lasius platythorax TaxID=488582 RepID=A0AAV2N2I0_9HYME
MYPGRAVLTCTYLEGMTDRERGFAGASHFGRRPISRTEIFLREGPGATFVTGRRSTSVASQTGEIRSVLIAPSRCLALIILAVTRKTHTYTCARAHTHTYTRTRFIYDARQSITNEHSTPGSN